jgi:DNA-binding MarR family transcriptional regulator
MQEQTKFKKRSEKARSMRLSSCGWYLGILGTWMDNQMEERLEPLGLTLNQFTIIMTLLEQEGLTQVEIGKRVMLPGYATTRIIDKLESLGYVKRRRHEASRRSYRIVLTEAGRALAPDLYRATKSVNERFLSPLDEEQKAEFLRILTGIASKHGLHIQD